MGQTLFSMKSWRTWLALGRVSNLPTVWSNVLAAILIAGVEPDANIVWLLLSATLLYEGGMWLNDAFDSEIDARERPQRPIPSGNISARSVFAVGFGLLLAGLILLSGSGWLTLIAGLLLALAIIAYDLHHKGVVWSPWLMGLCRALLYIMAGLAVTDQVGPNLIFAAFALWVYVAGLSYAAKHENLDRFQAGWPLALLIMPLFYGFIQFNLPALAYLILFAVWLVYCLWLLHHQHKTRFAVEGFIAGISLIDAFFIACSGAPFWAMLALIAFMICRRWQKHIAGT